MDNKMKNATKFQLRLPADVKEWLERDAQMNDRSMNGQVVALLRERMSKQNQSDAVANDALKGGQA